MIAELLELLHAKGVVLSLKEDNLSVTGDEAALSDESLLSQLRTHKPALIELLRSGHYTDGAAGVPPNNIPSDARYITPDMLSLVTLEQAEIDAIAQQVTGGYANIQDIYPLTSLQEGMLFHHMLSPAKDVYVEGFLLAFPSHARLARFIDALQQVIDRHDVLRTAIFWQGQDQALQVVMRQAAFHSETVAVETGQDVARQLEMRYDPGAYRLDIGRAPLLHGYQAEDSANDRWLLRILSHHIVIDHMTLELLVEEAQLIDKGQAHRLATPVPFRNFVAQIRQGVTEQQHQAFFSDMLGDVAEPTLPWGLLNAQGDGGNVQETQQMLPPSLSLALRAQARRQGITVASLMHFAWALVLGKASDRTDVVFGTVLFGRMQGLAGRTPGMLMNTLPLRIQLADKSVADNLQDVHQRLAQLLRHEHAPLTLAQRCSAVVAPTPLFTALLNYRYSAAQEADAPPDKDDVIYLNGKERTNYPLTLSVDDFGQDFSLTVQVDSSVAPECVCELMQNALARLVDLLDQQPDAPLSRLDILPAAEYQRVVRGWNDTARDWPDATLHQLFAEQAQRTPDAPAVEDERQQLSYAA
ncbi:condensation domain-containing protein, partial [Serratia rubidaea]|uniref:condensation domain-containing protein n=1 Tax=Serratia rubidaea TaxID=61652 RepID=UPI001CDA8A2E